MPPRTAAGVANRAPATRPSSRPTSGITASKNANVNAGRSGCEPRNPSATATASVSTPSGTTKTASFTNKLLAAIEPDRRLLAADRGAAQGGDDRGRTNGRHLDQREAIGDVDRAD